MNRIRTRRLLAIVVTGVAVLVSAQTGYATNNAGLSDENPVCLAVDVCPSPPCPTDPAGISDCGTPTSCPTDSAGIADCGSGTVPTPVVTSSTSISLPVPAASAPRFTG